MSKISLKRSSEHNFDEERTHLRKRVKVEVSIIDDDLTDGENIEKNTDENIEAKSRNKLLTSLHLKKRYKYHCKQKNVSYLIDIIRKKAKESSKDNRNNLIQSFRDFRISSEKQYKPDNNNNCTIDEENDDTINTEFVNKSRLIDTEENSYENEKPQLQKKLLFREDDDSGSELDYKEALRIRRKIIRCLRVKKKPGEDYVGFSDTEDFIEVDINDDDEDDDDEDEYFDCYKKLKFSYYNYEYDTSSTDDDS